MLQDNDLERFLRTYNDVISEQSNEGPSEQTILRYQSDGLFPAEVKRLSRSVAIACVLGDASEDAASAIQEIWRSLDRDQRYASLDDVAAWQQVIRHFKEQVDAAGEISSVLDRISRETQVGSACLRLRNMGFGVQVGAYGPVLDDESQEAICRKIDSHLSLIGGLDCLSRICRFFYDTKSIHDGMWLFGDRVPGVFQVADPAVPIGWLFSLSMKHLNKDCTTTQPDIEWEAAVKLATDFAATLDFQRYSQFEQIDIQACEFYPALAQSIGWRELFALPQAPSLVIDALDGAFNEVAWPSDFLSTKTEALLLIEEIRRLLSKLFVHSPDMFKQDQIEKEYPNLKKFGQRSAEEINNDYLSPFSMDSRNHDSTVFFDLGNGNALVLPKSMTAGAACEVLFRHIWLSLGKEATKLVGDIVEKCVARACRERAESVVEQDVYTVGKTKFEIDVGTRTNDDVILFEMKAKALTSKARSGDMFAFIDDFTKSYLHMLIQLFRHEKYIGKGVTSLVSDDDSNLRVTKVAVSPLSFGPVSDHVLANSLLRSIAFARLHAVKDDEKISKIIEGFNKAVEQLMAEITTKLHADIKETNLRKELFDLFWLDLGQLLYILNRAGSVKNALRPLRHVTFSTHDFWTEVALLDTQGLTRQYWAGIRSV